MDEELKKEIRKMALQNAFEHGGQTQDKIILGKILGTKPEFRTKVKEITGYISEIVANVNQLSSEVFLTMSNFIPNHSSPTLMAA